MPNLWSERRDLQRILKKILLVNLENKKFEIVNLKVHSIGGSSLARELLLTFKNSLIITPGLLTGTSAPTGGRYSLGMKTDYGHHISSIGGFIGAYIRGYGIDGVVITGKSEEKMILKLSSNKVFFDSASDFLEKSVFQIANVLEKKGKKTIIVGPAGERGSNISSLISERFRSFGKGSGKALFEMGVKALVFSPAQSIAKSERFIKEALKIREKLKAKDKSVRRYGHPCYGCPISCAAMEGRLKKGVSRILRNHENAEGIVNMANDFGVDIFGAHLASKTYGYSIVTVIKMAKDGKSFNVKYPDRPVDNWKDYLDSLGICLDASKFLKKEDIENLHKFFIEKA